MDHTSYCHRKVMKALKRLFLFLLMALLMPQVLSAQSCLPEGITFTTQSQIDSFSILYPNCTEIEGDVIIPYPNSVTSLQGLNAITAIGGELLISDCNELTSLEGLNNLQSIGGSLSLISNDNLLSLSALQNLRTIGGGLTISWNYRIKTLSGLDSINAETISNLAISYNDSLSWCAIESVCQYIANPNGSIVIMGNSIDCYNVEVVEEFCQHVSIPEFSMSSTISTYPNPFTISTTIEYKLIELSHVQLTIYNAIGEVVYTERDRMMPQGKHTFTWNADRLPEGFYYAVMRSEEGVSVVKMVKQQ